MSYKTGPVSRNALVTARLQGLPIPQRPEDDAPHLPEDITDLSDQELMMLYAHFTAWCDYAAVQAACAITDEKYAGDHVNAVEARAMLANSTSGTKVTVARTQTKTDQDLIDAKRRYLECEAYRRLVESLYTSYERSAQLLSREITRRTSPRRESNLP